MKLNAKKQTLIILALILFCSIAVQAQKKLLAARDKAQIIAAILRKEDFFEDDPSEANKKKEVYLLADSISAKYLPRVKNVKFILLSRNQIERMKKTGVEYYSFNRFKVTRKAVRVKFAKDYVHLDAEYAAGKSTIFKCRRVARRWKVVAVRGSGYVSEKSGL